MAEVAFVASIIQVADIGIRLSLRLYAFGETVASADQAILAISKDVSLTSSVLKELGNTFEGDKENVRSQNAVETAETIVRECAKVFEEMDTMLLAKVPGLQSISTDRKFRAKNLLERLRWPTIKGKIQLLNSNLDRLKSTLTLMLNVIVYARQISEKTEAPHTIAEQRQLIEDLVAVNQDRSIKHDQMKLMECADHTTIDEEGSMATQRNFSLPLKFYKPGPLEAERRGFLETLNLDNDSIKPGNLWDNGIRGVVEQYTRLRKNLLAEIRSSRYSIEDDSKIRLKRHIDIAHESELSLVLNDSWPLISRRRLSSDTPVSPAEQGTFSPDLKPAKFDLSSGLQSTQHSQAAGQFTGPFLQSYLVEKGEDATGKAAVSFLESQTQNISSDASPYKSDIQKTVDQDYLMSDYGSHSGSRSPYRSRMSATHAGQSFQNEVRSPLDQEPVILEQPKKPQCWDHVCNGRTFSTFSNLLRHQREKSGSSSKSVCPRCGAEFTSKKARDGHMAHDECKARHRAQLEHGREEPSSFDTSHPATSGPHTLKDTSLPPNGAGKVTVDTTSIAMRRVQRRKSTHVRAKCRPHSRWDAHRQEFPFSLCPQATMPDDRSQEPVSTVSSKQGARQEKTPSDGEGGKRRKLGKQASAKNLSSIDGGLSNGSMKANELLATWTNLKMV
ncbi:uncharacterized protein KY384_007557 [Bacidia gigantensis]|uniref:uncharacterized protein n=1 Tax=Bacidia gigantensis TaxID=2732470 RepID=UPI001D05AEFF|nr:uncharacterized protein KY384_007557 [Bacidia gigantensis]KAG8527405.1 hypothetical protein KY384_007557 [Bacidia gigantensis]